MTHAHTEEHQHDHHHGHGEHSHVHGAMDPSITTSERGIWAVKWSFVGLFVTALLQAAVVALSGSVALLSDTIHNFGDALTAVPLWIAFALNRLGTSRRFTFGYGRVEDLAGVIVVLIILFSAVVAGYQAIERLINPHPVEFLSAVAVASLLGFIGNEAVAVFRIRVGRQIGSAALVADGYHARTTVGPASPSSWGPPGCGSATRWPIPSWGSSSPRRYSSSSGSQARRCSLASWTGWTLR